MSGFFDDLERQLVQAGQRRHAPGGGARRAARSARRPLGTAVGVAALAALLVGTVIALAGRGEDEPGRRIATPAAADAKRKPPTVVVLRREGAGAPMPAGTARIGKLPGTGLDRTLIFAAAGIAPRGNHYAGWVIGATPRFLGFFPPVTGDGRLQGNVELTTLRGVREILVTRETVDRPQRPGEVVLRGRPEEVVVRKLRPGTKPRPFIRPYAQTGRLPGGQTYVVTAQPVDRGPAKVCLSIRISGVGGGKACGAAPVAGHPTASLHEAPGGGWVAYGLVAQDDPATQVRVQGAGEIASVLTPGALRTWSVFVPHRCAPLVIFVDRSGKETARDRPNPRPGDIEDCP
jgi:hypothetical protein